MACPSKPRLTPLCLLLLPVGSSPVYATALRPRREMDLLKRPPDDSDVSTAPIDAHNLFGNDVGTPLAGGSAGLRWCWVNNLAGVLKSAEEAAIRLASGE